MKVFEAYTFVSKWSAKRFRKKLERNGYKTNFVDHGHQKCVFGGRYTVEVK